MIDILVYNDLIAKLAVDMLVLFMLQILWRKPAEFFYVCSADGVYERN